MENKDNNIKNKNELNKENKIINFFKENKKLIIISGTIIIILVVILLLMLFLNNDKAKSNEKELIKTLELMGGAYYEEFYYPQCGDTDKKRAEFIQKFKDTGITTTIDNLKLTKERVKVVKDNIDNLKNSITEKECDLKNSKVQIVPKEPYGVKDYEVNVTLVCGFED